MSYLPMIGMLAFSLAAGALAARAAAVDAGGAKAVNAPEPRAWAVGKTFELKGLKVTLTAPLLVKRDREPYFFPKIARLPNGEIILQTTIDCPVDQTKNAADSFGPERSEVLWSSDGGLTWKDPQIMPDASSDRLFLPSGDLLYLPYRTYTCAEGVKGTAYLVPKGKRELKVLQDAVTVTGWPRPLACSNEQKSRGQAGWCFDGAPVVKLKDGTYLATISGWFEQKDKKNFAAWSGESKVSLVALESKDGFHWKVRSVMADENSGLPGKEGASEATVIRLNDGRLMSIFRQGCQSAEEIAAGTHRYGQIWSSDEGLTWTKPALCDPWAVQPRIERVLEGSLILAGGRPDIHLWFDAEGKGRDWQHIDLLAFHNEFRPQEAIQRNRSGLYYPYGMSTCNSEVVALDAHTALVCYDKTPRSATYQNTRGPKDTSDPAEMYSVWIVKVSVEAR